MEWRRYIVIRQLVENTPDELRRQVREDRARESARGY